MTRPRQEVASAALQRGIGVSEEVPNEKDAGLAARFPFRSPIQHRQGRVNTRIWNRLWFRPQYRRSLYASHPVPRTLIYD